MSPNERLPILHRNPRSRQKLPTGMQEVKQTYGYDYGQGQFGAAWHAVAMAREEVNA